MGCPGWSRAPVSRMPSGRSTRPRDSALSPGARPRCSRRSAWDGRCHRGRSRHPVRSPDAFSPTATPCARRIPPIPCHRPMRLPGVTCSASRNPPAGVRPNTTRRPSTLDAMAKPGPNAPSRGRQLPHTPGFVSWTVQICPAWATSAFVCTARCRRAGLPRLVHAPHDPFGVSCCANRTPDAVGTATPEVSVRFRTTTRRPVGVTAADSPVQPLHPNAAGS